MPLARLPVGLILDLSHTQRTQWVIPESPILSLICPNSR